MQLVKEEPTQYMLKISATLIIDEDDIPVDLEDRELNYEIEADYCDPKSIQRIVDEISNEFDSLNNMKITDTDVHIDDPEDSTNPSGQLDLSIKFSADTQPSNEDCEDLAKIILDEFVDHNKALATGEITYMEQAFNPMSSEYIERPETTDFSDYLFVTYSDVATTLETI